jgi:hypothetical protein
LLKNSVGQFDSFLRVLCLFAASAFHFMAAGASRLLALTMVAAISYLRRRAIRPRRRVLTWYHTILLQGSSRDDYDRPRFTCPGADARR